MQKIYKEKQGFDPCRPEGTALPCPPSFFAKLDTNALALSHMTIFFQIETILSTTKLQHKLRNVPERIENSVRKREIMMVRNPLTVIHTKSNDACAVI